MKVRSFLLPVILRDFYTLWLVAFYRCPCGAVVPFDGQHYALLVPDAGKFMYTYELLLEYLGLAVQNGISVSSFRAQKSQRWTLHRDMPIPSVAQLYYALKRFTELLKLDEMPEAQRCPHCQDEPDIILCDGTQATIRANQVRGNDCDRHVSAVTMSVHSTVEYVNRSSASCSYSFVQFSLMPIRDAKVREQLNRALEIKCADTDLLAHFSAPAREQSTYPVAEQIADYLLQYLQTWPNSADLLMFMRALAAGNTLYTALISDRAARAIGTSQPGARQCNACDQRRAGNTALRGTVAVSATSASCSDV